MSRALRQPPKETAIEERFTEHDFRGNVGSDLARIERAADLLGHARAKRSRSGTIDASPTDQARPLTRGCPRGIPNCPCPHSALNGDVTGQSRTNGGFRFLIRCGFTAPKHEIG
jgi:hypothetical protein